MLIQIRDSSQSAIHKGPRKLGDIGFTLVHPFYNEKTRFDKHYEYWINWSSKLKEKIKIVLVDDGSPEPVHTWITPSKNKRLKYFNFTIYRILEDLKWNTPGALNLGFVTAPTEFVLCMDSDCAFSPEQLEKFLEISPREDFVYKFPRKRIGNENENLKNDRYLPCTMLLHKNIFFAVNGFDEDFTGANSGGWAFFDNDFDYKIMQIEYNWGIWHDVIATEWMPSTCGPRLNRTRTEEIINKKLMYQKWNKEIPINRKILNFPWERVYHNVL